MDRKLIVAGFLPLYDCGKTLLLRRRSSKSFLSGYYELPGGKVESGEDPINAIEREFFEETGLNIKALEPFHTYSSLISKENIQYVQIAYLVECKESISNLRLSKEHQSYLIASEDDLGNLLITEEEMGTIFKGFKKFINIKNN